MNFQRNLGVTLPFLSLEFQIRPGTISREYLWFHEFTFRLHGRWMTSLLWPWKRTWNILVMEPFFGCCFCFYFWTILSGPHHNRNWNSQVWNRLLKFLEGTLLYTLLSTVEVDGIASLDEEERLGEKRIKKIGHLPFGFEKLSVWQEKTWLSCPGKKQSQKTSKHWV